MLVRTLGSVAAFISSPFASKNNLVAGYAVRLFPLSKVCCFVSSTKRRAAFSKAPPFSAMTSSTIDSSFFRSASRCESAFLTLISFRIRLLISMSWSTLRYSILANSAGDFENRMQKSFAAYRVHSRLPPGHSSARGLP